MIVCGTGHRPNKLDGYDECVWGPPWQVAVDWLRENESKVERVISGGALGWDQELARACYTMCVPFALYLPFKDFDSKWPIKSREELEWLCGVADDIIYVCEPGYAPWKMQVRNEAMVNDSDLVLALWDGTPGGTANCIKYASKIDKPIENLWEKYSEKENT